MNCINIIGGGLAGCEAAHFIAGKGLKVRLFEMRPLKKTPVHNSAHLAELVCSNSLKSELEDTAQGLLKKEMKFLGSLLLECAELCRVPAGSALAVDRELFSHIVTQRIEANDNIEVIREEKIKIPEKGISIIATGPLTSDGLSHELQAVTGMANLHFYDAVAPSVTVSSLNMNKLFRASRYGKGTDDYLNCPFTKEEYEIFYNALIEADTVEEHSIDKKEIFEGCMPVEIMARRGIDTLRFGPMRPVGLKDPRGDGISYAVIQLRQEDREGNIYGLVGFQTRLRWGEQEKVFRLIPGLEKAEFVRKGVMHRNTYINSPILLDPTLQYRTRPELFFAGQITGVEGYMESASTGIIAGINASRIYSGLEPIVINRNTMIGSLLDFICNCKSKNFQPINANFGILPALDEKIKDKKARYRAYADRAMGEMGNYSELLVL